MKNKIILNLLFKVYKLTRTPDYECSSFNRRNINEKLMELIDLVKKDLK